MGNCLGFLKVRPRVQQPKTEKSEPESPTVVDQREDSVQSTRSERLETPQPPTDGPTHQEDNSEARATNSSWVAAVEGALGIMSLFLLTSSNGERYIGKYS